MSDGWNTIESDAGVFTSLLTSLGARGLQSEDLLSLDPLPLYALTPLYGLIFLFKYPSRAHDIPVVSSGAPDPSAAEELFFARQTIQNACGTQALLSVVLNIDVGEGEGGEKVDLGEDLREFKNFAMMLPTDLRGEALSNSERIREAHNSFARASPFAVDQRAAEEGEEGEDAFHFVAYVPVNGTLYELDGLREAPLNHGVCSKEEFPEKVVEVVRRRVEGFPTGELRFALLAVCGDLRERARRMGDGEGVEREERRRREWVWENALRRWNFVGFGAEVLRKVVGEKVREGEGGFEEWVGEARRATKKRREGRGE